eukprot:COSAG01_NODE_2061_length_8482_cov_6.301925_9_plen_59_part_00
MGFATADVPRAGSSADVRVQLVAHGGACTVSTLATLLIAPDGRWDLGWCDEWGGVSVS